MHGKYKHWQMSTGNVDVSSQKTWIIIVNPQTSIMPYNNVKWPNEDLKTVKNLLL